jgi:hypothetical protein
MDSQVEVKFRQVEAVVSQVEVWDCQVEVSFRQVEVWVSQVEVRDSQVEVSGQFQAG